MDRILDLSSKRTVNNHQVKSDISYLEFKEVFKAKHIQTLFQPSEMQWSIDEFVKKAEQHDEEGEARLKNIISERAKELEQ